MNEIDEYIAQYPKEIQDKLQEIRVIVLKIIPKAEEIISYGMPAFKWKKVIVYFAAYKNHIGFYPTSKPIEYFKDKLKEYKHSKGAIQFSFDKKLPKDLIEEIVKYRLENL